MRAKPYTAEHVFGRLWPALAGFGRSSRTPTPSRRPAELVPVSNAALRDANPGTEFVVLDDGSLTISMTIK